MKTFKNILSVTFVMVVIFATAALCIGCFFPVLHAFNIFTIGCGLLAAIIPGMFCYGLAAALTDFLGYTERSAPYILLAVVFSIEIAIGIVVMLLI